jgi:hypothetical protein
VLNDEIDRLKPRLEIVSIYPGNDFGDLMRDKIYKLAAHGQLKDNDYTLDPSFVNLFAHEDGDASHLYTIRLLQRVWERFAPAEPTIPTSSN